MEKEQIKTNKPYFQNYVSYLMTGWFAILTVFYLFGHLWGSQSSYWMLYIILVIGVLSPLILLVFLTFKRMITLYQLGVFILYTLISLVIASVDFGNGWGNAVLWVSLAIQGVALIIVSLYGMMVLRSKKAYLLFVVFMMVVIINIGFSMDTALYFYPEIYGSIGLYSAFSYMICIALFNILNCCPRILKMREDVKDDKTTS